MKRFITFCTLHFALCTLVFAIAPPRDPSGYDDYARMIAMMHRQDSVAADSAKCVVGSAPRRVGTRDLQVPRVLVIMANFADWTLVTPKADVDSMFNGENWRKDDAKGSVRQYFHDQSSGAYNPQFDVVGPVTLSQNYAYYGANQGSSNSLRAGYMVTEACALVNDEVNFADYDSNNDGYVDMVFIYYAGFGENDKPKSSLVSDPENLVWPHYWTVSSAGCGTNTRVFDGKTVNAYECANELDGYYSTTTKNVVAGIGVLVHEFCHGLGLPDMYKTVNGTHKTLGYWSIMDYGPYADDMHSPPSLTAYERWFVGWLQPAHLCAPSNDTLRALSEVNEAYYITQNGEEISNILTPSPATFWLLENRQLTGWDRGLPGAGMLVTKVQYSASKWSGNTVNNTATAMGVDIMEADGLAPTSAYDDFYGKQGDCYPYQNRVPAFAQGEPMPISELTMEDGVVTFLYEGGAPEPGPATLINETQTRSRAVKRLENGQLILEYGKTNYTLLGTRL